MQENIKNDTISRQAAIEALHDEIVRRRIEDSNDDGALDEFDTETILRRLPPEQSEPQWIPCSERVPEKSGIYIITDKHGNVNVVRFHATDIEFVKEYWKSQTEAWMPWPKPYQAERREE